MIRTDAVKCVAPVDIVDESTGEVILESNEELTQEHLDELRSRGIEEIELLFLDPLTSGTALRDTLHENTRYFREQMQANGFAVPEGDHPIVPVMLGDAVVAQQMSERLLELGIYAIGFFYPVVPQGKARIRVQISAGHTQDDLDKAVAAFATAYGEIAT